MCLLADRWCWTCSMCFLDLDILLYQFLFTLVSSEMSCFPLYSWMIFSLDVEVWIDSSFLSGLHSELSRFFFFVFSFQNFDYDVSWYWYLYVYLVWYLLSFLCFCPFPRWRIYQQLFQVLFQLNPLFFFFFLISFLDTSDMNIRFFFSLWPTVSQYSYCSVYFLVHFLSVALIG